ncbi:Kelch-Like Protein 4 [Manis pentadactyla]|nr:Kelch-Like Protein 4 [Manis pentadactyla]
MAMAMGEYPRLDPQHPEEMDVSRAEEFVAVNHAEKTLHKIENYLKEKQLCDVILIAGNMRIPAPCDMREAGQEEVKMEGIDPSKHTIEKYDLRTNSWQHNSTMSSLRFQFGVAVIDNKLYVLGGSDGLKTLNTMECFDPTGKMWTVMFPMSTPRHGLGYMLLVDVLDVPASNQWNTLTHTLTNGVCMLLCLKDMEIWELQHTMDSYLLGVIMS